MDTPNTRAAWMLAAVLALSSPGFSQAQVCSTGRGTTAPIDAVLIDHAAGVLVVNGDTLRDPEAPFYVRPGRPLVVCVTNTNTALFTYGLESKEVDAPEVEDLKAFLRAAGPYAVDVLTTLPFAKAPDTSATSPVDSVYGVFEAARANLKSILESKISPGALQRRLDTLDALVTHQAPGRRPLSLKQIDLETLRLLDRLRARPGHVVGLREEFREEMGGTFVVAAGRYHLRTIGRLTEQYERLPAEASGVRRRLGSARMDLEVLTAASALNRATAALNEALGSKDGKVVVPEPPFKPYETLLANAEAALADAKKTIQAAYAVEAAATALLEAETEWRHARSFKVKADKGREGTIKIEKKADPDLARAAAVWEPRTITFSARPGWRIRPAVGLSLVGALRATYPAYATQEVDGRTFAQETEVLDRRFTYTLDLALTTARWDRRQEDGTAFWFPVFSINPSDDVRAVGVGAGFTFARLFKLGAGLLWTKHEVLDGISEGEEVLAERPFRTRHTYGKARGYVSLSITGWPPFTRE